MPNCEHRELSTLASPVWLQVSSHTSEICSGSSAEANTLQSLGKSGAGYPAHTPHGAHHSQGSLPARLSRSFSIAQQVSQSYDTTQWGDRKTDLHDVLSIPTQPRHSSTRFRTRETRATQSTMLLLKGSIGLSAVVKHWCICAKMFYYINVCISLRMRLL